jgi:hypothetical protein
MTGDARGLARIGWDPQRGEIIGGAVTDRPTIPTSEFTERLAHVQSAMGEQGLDVLVLYGDDRAVFGANATRWLLDYAAHFESCCVIVPRSGVPHVATGAEAELFYRNTARLGQVHVVRDFCMPDEEYPYTHPITFDQYVVAARQEMDGDVRRVGIVERLTAAGVLQAEEELPTRTLRLISLARQTPPGNEDAEGKQDHVEQDHGVLATS